MRFQHCSIPFLEPYSPRRFLSFRAIQGHSGGTVVDPTLQDNVPILDEFAEYINHIGNVTDMHSITNSRLIPGGGRLRKERQCMFFTAGNPMDEHRFPENARYDLDKSSNCSVQKPIGKFKLQFFGATWNLLTRNRLVWHSTCDLYWNSGAQEKLEINYFPKSMNPFEDRVSSSRLFRNIKVDMIFFHKMRDICRPGKQRERVVRKNRSGTVRKRT